MIGIVATSFSVLFDSYKLELFNLKLYNYKLMFLGKKGTLLNFSKVVHFLFIKEVLKLII